MRSLSYGYFGQQVRTHLFSPRTCPYDHTERMQKTVTMALVTHSIHNPQHTLVTHSTRITLNLDHTKHDYGRAWVRVSRPRTRPPGHGPGAPGAGCELLSHVRAHTQDHTAPGDVPVPQVCRPVESEWMKYSDTRYDCPFVLLRGFSIELCRTSKFRKEFCGSTYEIPGTQNSAHTKFSIKF